MFEDFGGLFCFCFVFVIQNLAAETVQKCFIFIFSKSLQVYDLEFYKYVDVGALVL